MTDTPDFPRWLFDGSDDLATLSTGRARIERRRLGSVDLPDGGVYACDPLVPMDVQPFAQGLDPGVYEAVLFVAVRTDPEAAGLSPECNVAAALVCTSERPVTWTRASREGGDAESGAYGVDSGTGCFMGNRAAKSVFSDEDASREAILAALEQTAGAMVVLEEGASVAAFQSGIGDGCYDTWWGYDARGAVSMILTDFGVLESTAAVAVVHAGWARRSAKKWWQIWK